MSSNGNGTDEILKPRAEWIVKRKAEAADGSNGLSMTILIAVILACVVAWLAGLLHIFAK